MFGNIRRIMDHVGGNIMVKKIVNEAFVCFVFVFK